MIKAEDLRIGDLVRVSRDCAFPKGTVCIITDIHAEKTTTQYTLKYKIMKQK